MKTIAEYIAHAKGSILSRMNYQIMRLSLLLIQLSGAIIKCLENQWIIKMQKNAREISGNTHEVITGVTLLSMSKEKTFSVSYKSDI